MAKRRKAHALHVNHLVRCEERAWGHLDTMQFKTLLVCPVPRVNCKEHGIKSFQVPCADMKGRFTRLFERFAIDVLHSANNKSKAAELLGLSWDEVHHIQERAVERGLAKISMRAKKELISNWQKIF